MINLEEYDIIGVCPNDGVSIDSLSNRLTNIPNPHSCWLDKGIYKKNKNSKNYNINNWGPSGTVCWIFVTEDGCVQLMPGDKIVVLRPKNKNI